MSDAGYDEDDDFEDDDDDYPYNAGEFQALALQIRSLSSAVFLSGQHTYSKSSSLEPDRHPLVAIVRALATLLTRNSCERVVAVTGSPSDCSSQTTPHDSFIALIPMPLQYSAHPGDPGVWNILSHIDIVPRSDNITPSLSSVRRRSQVDDRQHAETVLAIISSFRDANDATKSRIVNSSLRYIINQCWEDIYSRFFASTQLYAGRRLGDILLGWRPAAIDRRNLSGGWVRVCNGTLASKLQVAHVPHRRDSDATSSLFFYHWYTLEIWHRVFCDTIVTLLVAGGISVDSATATPPRLADIATSIPVLAALLETVAVLDMLQLPSLQVYLSSFAEQGHDRTYLQDRVGCAIIADQRRSNETPGEHILRYLTSLTSWYTSLCTLTQAYDTPELSLPSLRLVFCGRTLPFNTPNRRLFDILSPDRAAVKNQVLEYVRGHVSNREDLDDWLGDIFNKMFTLGGQAFEPIETTHTEALLMDFVAHIESDEKHIFSACRSSRTFGIPNQFTMCYCCNFLRSILFDPSQHILVLQRLGGILGYSSAFPGHVEPWTPPRLYWRNDAVDGIKGGLTQLFAAIIASFGEDMTPTATPHLSI